MNNFAMPRPDLAYGGPGPILAVALQEQQASWAFYTSAVATHGNQAPLQTLLDSTAQRITLLGNLYQQFGVPLPALSSPTPEPLVTGWRESLERAMQGTFNSAGVYQQLVTLTPDPTLRREFERLQSDLLTRDLPALQRAWQAAVDRERLHAAQGIDPCAALIHGVGDDAAGDLGATTLDDVLELVTVLPGVDGRGGGADELDVVLIEHTALDQAHGGVEGGLPAQGGQDRVGAFFIDNFFDDLGGDRLDVGGVGDVGVGHDRGRVGVDQDDADSLSTQDAAGLGAGVVELAGLPDDDGARSDDEDGADIRANRHVSSCPCGPGPGGAPA